MTSVNDVSIVKDVTLNIRDLIMSGISDPISATRTTNSKFVMTSHPERPVDYPVIIIEANPTRTRHKTIGDESQMYGIDVRIDILSENVKERDILTGSVINYLRSNQRDISSNISGTQTWGLYDYNLLNMNNYDNVPGYEGVHGKQINVGYTYVAGD